MLTGGNSIKILHAAIKCNRYYIATSFPDKILYCIILLGFVFLAHYHTAGIPHRRLEEIL